jgi:hypothetical protein
LPQTGAQWWSILTTHTEAPLALRQGNSAQDTLGNQALRGALARVLAQMVAYTQFDPSLPTGTHHGHGIIQRRGHGFFHQHMLSSPRCSERLRGVQGVWRGDEHRLHARVAQQRLQITIRRFSPMLLGKGFSASLVPAINGHQLGIWGRVERRGNFDIGMQSCRDDGPAKRHTITPSKTCV